MLLSRAKSHLAANITTLRRVNEDSFVLGPISSFWVWFIAVLKRKTISITFFRQNALPKMLPHQYLTIGARRAPGTSTLRFAAAYVVDWIVVIVVAVAGGILNYVSGYHHAFTLSDESLSYPLTPNTVSITVVGLVAFLAPALIIAVLTMLLPPQRLLSQTSPAAVWRTKLGDVHLGVLGLALCLAATLFVTSGLKDLVGKPRPDLIARCQPDLTQISHYIVSGLGLRLPEAPVLVSSKICQQSNTRVLDDGFASFPSGHSSFSWAGLGYLSLWLCARLEVVVPQAALLACRGREIYDGDDSRPAGVFHLWRFFITSTPIIGALVICASRYSDYHHAGFDIIAGSIIGAAFAILSFRIYHRPLLVQLGLASTSTARRDNLELEDMPGRESVSTGSQKPLYRGQPPETAGRGLTGSRRDGGFQRQGDNQIDV